MIVRIKSKDGPNLFIPFPLGLVCNRFTAGIAARAAAEGGVSATPEQMARLFRTIQDCKRRFPGWVITEVESADGDYVYVKL